MTGMRLLRYPLALETGNDEGFHRLHPFARSILAHSGVWLFISVSVAGAIICPSDYPGSGTLVGWEQWLESAPRSTTGSTPH